MDKDLQKFIDSCILKEHLEQQDDIENANKQYTILNSIARRLKKKNQTEKLLILLEHENDHVRLWAITYLLDEFPEEALRVLKDIATLKDWEQRFIIFDAVMSLSVWISKSPERLSKFKTIAISREKLEEFGSNIAMITEQQHKVYSEFKKTGQPFTKMVMEKLEKQALINAKIPDRYAEYWVGDAVLFLTFAEIPLPMQIPWGYTFDG